MSRLEVKAAELERLLQKRPHLAQPALFRGEIARPRVASLTLPGEADSIRLGAYPAGDGMDINVTEEIQRITAQLTRCLQLSSIQENIRAGIFRAVDPAIPASVI